MPEEQPPLGLKKCYLVEQHNRLAIPNPNGSPVQPRGSRRTLSWQCSKFTKEGHDHGTEYEGVGCQGAGEGGEDYCKADGKGCGSIGYVPGVTAGCREAKTWRGGCKARRRGKQRKLSPLLKKTRGRDGSTGSRDGGKICIVLCHMLHLPAPSDCLVCSSSHASAKRAI